VGPFQSLFENTRRLSSRDLAFASSSDGGRVDKADRLRCSQSNASQVAFSPDRSVSGAGFRDLAGDFFREREDVGELAVAVHDAFGNPVAQIFGVGIVARVRERQN
jgi:hypothetical protein